MTVLLILKILGALLTAGGLLHKALKSTTTTRQTLNPDPDYPDNVVEEKRASRISNAEWIFIIGGLLVTVISFIVEGHNSQRSAADARIQASNQLARAEQQITTANEILKRLETQGKQSAAILTDVEEQGKIGKQSLDALADQAAQFSKLLTNVQAQGALAKTTLNRVHRIVTRFDKVYFTVQYKLPESYRLVSLLSAMTNSLYGNMRDSRTADSKDGRNVFARDAVGYFHIGDNASVVLGCTYNFASKEASMQLKSNTRHFLEATTNYPSTFPNDLDYLANPTVIFGVFAPKRTSPDLVVRTTNMVGPAMIIYDFVTSQFSIRWSFTCPNSQWQQTKRMLSLPDLAEARIYHSLLKWIPKTLEGMQPVREVIRFDQTTLETTNFTKPRLPGLAPPTNLRIASTDEVSLEQPIAEQQIVTDIDLPMYSYGNWFYSVLPSEDQILNQY